MLSSFPVGVQDANNKEASEKKEEKKKDSQATATKTQKLCKQIRKIKQA